MLKTKKIDADKIKITHLRTIRGNIESSAEFDIALIKGHRFSFDLKTALKKDLKTIGLKLQVDIVAQDDNTIDLPARGSYTHEMIFQIDNLDEFVITQDGVDRIDLSMGSTLVSIIYSTVRGIIFSRTQGTSLDVVVLPVVAPFRLMGVDMNDEGKPANKTEKKSGKRDNLTH